MPAFEIKKPPTAFSMSSGRKRPREENASHLAWIRKLPCAVCGIRVQIEAAHLRIANPQFGKRETGLSEKPSDKWVLPLCAGHHDAQHKTSETDFWSRHKINPFLLAMSLWSCSGDEAIGEMLVREARKP